MYIYYYIYIYYTIYVLSKSLLYPISILKKNN